MFNFSVVAENILDMTLHYVMLHGHFGLNMLNVVFSRAVILVLASLYYLFLMEQS